MRCACGHAAILFLDRDSDMPTTVRARHAGRAGRLRISSPVHKDTVSNPTGSRSCRCSDFWQHMLPNRRAARWAFRSHETVPVMRFASLLMHLHHVGAAVRALRHFLALCATSAPVRLFSALWCGIIPQVIPDRALIHPQHLRRFPLRHAGRRDGTTSDGHRPDFLPVGSMHKSADFCAFPDGRSGGWSRSARFCWLSCWFFIERMQVLC